MPLRSAALHGTRRTWGGWSELQGKPLQFFPRTRQLRSMETETIYVEGDRATAATESPKFISSGGSRAQTETPISIIGGGLGSGHVVDSKRAMRELIPLGRSSAAHLENFVRTGDLQAGQSVVGGRRGGQIMRERSSGSSLPMAAAGLKTQFPLQQGMDLTSEAPNACKNHGARHQSPQHMALFRRSAAFGPRN